MTAESESDNRVISHYRPCRFVPLTPCDPDTCPLYDLIPYYVSSHKRSGRDKYGEAAERLTKDPPGATAGEEAYETIRKLCIR